MFGQTEGLSCLFLFLYLTIHLGSVSINGKQFRLYKEA